LYFVKYLRACNVKLKTNRVVWKWVWRRIPERQIDKRRQSKRKREGWGGARWILEDDADVNGQGSLDKAAWRAITARLSSQNGRTMVKML
jgi:hypothetical protein